jgi:hypothetical protein
MAATRSTLTLSVKNTKKVLLHWEQLKIKFYANLIFFRAAREHVLHSSFSKSRSFATKHFTVVTYTFSNN